MSEGIEKLFREGKVAVLDETRHRGVRSVCSVVEAYWIAELELLVVDLSANIGGNHLLEPSTFAKAMTALGRRVVVTINETEARTCALRRALGFADLFHVEVKTAAEAFDTRSA